MRTKLPNRYLLLAIAIHALWLILLFDFTASSVNKPHLIVNKSAPTIHSYLVYRTPVSHSNPVRNSNTIAIQPKKLRLSEPLTNLPKTSRHTLKPAHLAAPKQPNSNALSKQTTPRVESAHVDTFAMMQHLHVQQNALDQRVIEQAVRQHQQQTSRPSIFNDKPITVNHSQAQITKDQRTTSNTTTLSSSITIIKGNDGTCTIKQDLTSVGMDGITSLQFFKCGSTKLERMYRDHMAKVLNKLGK